MNAPLYLQSIYAHTPLGHRADSTAAALRAGISALREHPLHTDAAGEPVRGSYDRSIEPTLRGPDRCLALLEAPLAEALTIHARRGPGLILTCVPQTRPGWTPAHSEALTRTVADWAPGQSHGRAGQGRCAGFEALDQARAWLERSPASWCLIAAVDSYFDKQTLRWLEAERRLAASRTRGGFFPGEGAVVLALVARPAKPLARVVAWSAEQVPPRELPSNGVELSQVIDATLTQGITEDARLETVLTPLNGERPLSREWALASQRLGPRLGRPGLHRSIATELGELGCVGPLLSCLVPVWGWLRGHLESKSALVWTASETGGRGALLLQHPQSADVPS